MCLAGIDTLTTITCQYRWLAHSGSQQNQSFAIVADNPKRLRERLYWANVSMPGRAIHNTWQGTGNPHRKDGRRSSAIMPMGSPRWISSSFRLIPAEAVVIIDQRYGCHAWVSPLQFALFWAARASRSRCVTNAHEGQESSWAVDKQQIQTSCRQLFKQLRETHAWKWTPGP